MKPWTRRQALWTLLAVLTAAAVWSTPWLWLRLEGWAENQRDRIWESLEDALGQKIVYDRIAPNVLAALDFQNVRMVAEDGSTLFRAASVRVSLDWGMLLRGRYSEALRRVQIINGTVDLDSARDRLALEKWSKMFQSKGGGGSPFDFEVEAFNLGARWVQGNQTLKLERGFAVLSPQGREWKVKFRGGLSWEEAGSGSYARTTLRGELRSDVSFQNLSLRTEASNVSTTWFDLSPVTLQVNVEPRQISIVKVSDRLPFDLQILWNRETNVWEAKGAAQDFVPSRVIRVKQRKELAGLAQGALSGRFAFQPGSFSFAGRASWPAGALPAPFAKGAEVAGAVAGTPDRYTFQNFRLQTADGAAKFDGDMTSALLPQGNLSVERWTVPGAGVARGSVQMTRQDNRVSFTGTGWAWNTLGSSQPSGWFEREGDLWRFAVAGPWDNTAGASYDVEGTLEPRQSRVDATVELIGLPLSLLRPEVQLHFKSLDLPPALWALETTVKAQVGWGKEGPSVSVSWFAFHDPLVPDRNGTGTAQWRGRHLDLALNPSEWDQLRARGKLALDLEDAGVVTGTLGGLLWDHEFEIQGRWVPVDRTFAFSGKPGIVGLIHQTDETWNAEVTLLPQPVAPGWTVGFQTSASLGQGKWTVDASRIDVTGVYPWSGEPFTAQTRAYADPSFVRLDGLSVKDSKGVWEGAAISSWSGDYSQPWAGRLALAAGKESVTLDWNSAASDQWHFKIDAGVDVTRAGLPALAELVGRATVTGTADWKGAEAVWSVQTSLSEARYGDSPLGLRAAFAGTNHGMTVRGLNLALSPVRLNDGTAEVDFDGRKWSASLGVGVRLGAGDWESKWAASGGWEQEPGPLRVSGSLTARSNRWAQKNFDDWTVKGDWSPDAWNFSMLGVAAQGKGQTLQVRAQAPFPVQGDAQGTWAPGALNIAVKGFRADLDLVRTFVNTKYFSIASGTSEGDFLISGAPSDPDVTGTLVLRGLIVDSIFVRQTVGPFDLPLVLDGHRVRLDSVDIGPGAQTWLVSGEARLDHLLPEDYRFRLQTDTLSLVPVSYQYTGISASGGVNGEFFIQGSPLAVTLGGRLVLQDGVITLKPSSGKEVRRDDPLGFNVDLTLITGRKVEFLWPNETLPLLRAVSAAGQVLTVKTNDVASTWSVVGKLGMRTGEINYLNRTFLIKEGTLTMQEDQTRFDPRVTVRAEWKLRETDGTVIIGLRADGTLSAFSPRFDAVPYKSPDELAQLVGTTLALPTDYTKATNVETALSVASDVGTSLLLTPFEEAVKKNFQLDLFTVKTEILKKSLLNRNGPTNAVDYLDNTRLFFGKYIGDDLFLQGTLAFRQDNILATQVAPKMIVEPEFQMELDTPFFLLNWTLLPQHPETLFVTDNTVTFRWNWSY